MSPAFFYWWEAGIRMLGMGRPESAARGARNADLSTSLRSGRDDKDCLLQDYGVSAGTS